MSWEESWSPDSRVRPRWKQVWDYRAGLGGRVKHSWVMHGKEREMAGVVLWTEQHSAPVGVKLGKIYLLPASLQRGSRC